VLHQEVDHSIMQEILQTQLDQGRPGPFVGWIPSPDNHSYQWEALTSEPVPDKQNSKHFYGYVDADNLDLPVVEGPFFIGTDL
jgi:hypothetical protein